MNCHVAKPVATTASRCRICGHEFQCPVNQVQRREVCTPPHPRRGREKCRCCACRWSRLRDNNKLIDFMSSTEAVAFLAAAKKQRGNFYLAFRLAIDGMMFLTELAKLKVTDVFSSSEECHLMLPIPRHHSMRVKVELVDCETVELLRRRLNGRGRGRVFLYSKRTFQRAFRKAIADAGLLDYTFMTLRQTGISIRAKEIRSAQDQETVRKAARLFCLESLKPYLPKETSTSTLTKRVRRLR